MTEKESRKHAGKARKRRPYEGLGIVLKNGRRYFSYYPLITSFKYIPADGEEPDTLKIKCNDYDIIITGENLLPVNNDLTGRAVGILYEGKSLDNPEGEPSVISFIEIVNAGQ